MERTAQVLEQAAGKIGLKINIEKPKLWNFQIMNMDMETLIFKKDNEFLYTGVLLSIINKWYMEIELGITKRSGPLSFLVIFF